LVPCPPLFSVLMWVPSCDDVEVGIYKNQMVDLSLQLSSIYHDPDLMEEALEWFMEPKVKINSSTPRDDTSIINLNP